MKKKKWLILVIIFIILVIIYLWGSQPRKGKIIVSNDANKEVVNPGKITYENEFLSFEYDDDYEKISKDNDLWLNGRLEVTQSFTLLCRDLEGDMDEDSGVKMREVKKDEYDEENIEVAETQGRLFVKKDESERTFFISREGKLISLSMINRSTGDEALEKFQNIIESWEWK